MYITLEEYTQLYDATDEKAFTRNGSEACRIMDQYTTGADGFKKLKQAFPADADDAAAVKHCAARLINLLCQIEQVQTFGGYEATEQGVRGRVISSVSSGNESISYATNAVTAIEKAASDRTVKDAMITNIIRGGLSGIRDANGVNLLYMGPYPRGYVC